MPSDPTPLAAAATMREHVASAHDQLQKPGTVPQRLSAVASAICTAHHAVAALIRLGDPTLFPAYVTAQHHAAEAETALRTAPSLPRNHATAEPPPDAPVDSQDETATAVAALAEAATRELIHTAELAAGPTDSASADVAACLGASVHTSRLHETLR